MGRQDISESWCLSCKSDADAPMHGECRSCWTNWGWRRSSVSSGTTTRRCSSS